MDSMRQIKDEIEGIKAKIKKDLSKKKAGMKKKVN